MIRQSPLLLASVVLIGCAAEGPARPATTATAAPTAQVQTGPAAFVGRWTGYWGGKRRKHSDRGEHQPRRRSNRQLPVHANAPNALPSPDRGQRVRLRQHIPLHLPPPARWSHEWGTKEAGRPGRHHPPLPHLRRRNQPRSRISLALSRDQSRSAMAARLSCFFLPSPTPSRIFATPRSLN